MSTKIFTTPLRPGIVWASRIVSGLPVFFLLLSAAMKLAKPVPVVQEFARYGFQDGVIRWIGALELLCTLLYLIPRTEILGAILLTGYLGGATVTHLRIGDPPTSYGSLLFGVMLWGGIFLRDEKLRAMIPFRRRQT